MSERKIVLFILSVIVYSIYSVQMWFLKRNVEANVVQQNISEAAITAEENQSGPEIVPQALKAIVKPKVIPLFIKDACSILEVFTEKPTLTERKHKHRLRIEDNNTLTVIGITVFLLILLLNAILDVLKVKEEERARRKLNPDGERRQSLAEFANKKPLRRESSKFGLQLFQIAETYPNSEEEKKDSTRQTRPYRRGDSTNSYLSETQKKSQEGSAPASIAETPAGDARLVKRQSVARLFGGRPTTMVRRSSYPALPLNPEIQALMLGHRQTSVDSDDESDPRGRRVRLIRRF
uniref:SFRICE_024322 n=1 Tax=Spodoptera frugiperda TaxID=7108 RepID=A0A2H1V6H5_SPOFR